MALEQYAVRLTLDEREQLSQLIRSGKSSARIVARARILLKVAEGWNAPQVPAALDVSKGTVYRAKRRYAEEGLSGVIQDRVQANRYRKLDDRGEAHLIALACSPAPDGHDHWTLEPVYDLFRINTMKASTTICRLVLSFLSQFFQSRRHFSSQAKDRSTTHRFGSTTKVCSSLRFTTSTEAPNRPCTAVAKGFPV